MNLNKVEQNIIQLLEQSGEVVMQDFGKLTSYTLKAKSDIVTKIDKKVEKKIVDFLIENFPGFNIFSEEMGVIKKKSKYTWMIDPIDGTINYYSGMSPFRISMCLLENEEPIFSAIYNPVKKDIYTAQRGNGSYKNGRKLKVNTNSQLENSVVMTHLSSRDEARKAVLSSLNNVFEHVLQIRILGTGSASLCYIADGKYDAFYNVKTHPWDILPGYLVVEEAGGKVTDIEGKKITMKSESILASNGKVHKKLLNLI